MPEWMQASLAAIVANLIVWPVIFAAKRIGRRLGEARDVVDDAISDAIDVLDGWPTDDEPYCDCGECWPQTPEGLPRRVPTGAHDLLDLEPVARAQQIADLQAAFDMPDYIRPPVSPGRDQ